MNYVEQIFRAFYDENIFLTTIAIQNGDRKRKLIKL